MTSVEELRDACAQASIFKGAMEQGTYVPVSIGYYTAKAILEKLDSQAAEIERLKKRQHWDDIESTRLSCTLMGLQREIEKQAAEISAKDAERKDLAMLVRRLCYAMSKTGTHAKLQEQSLDYLKRKGLQGDIVRGDNDGAKH